jgi:hypothetical protein
MSCAGGLGMSDEGILTVPREAALMPLRIPALTPAMIGGLVAVFAAELAFPDGPRSDPLTPGIRTLVAFGGLQRLLVVNAGEFYRLLSVALVHANALRLPPSRTARRSTTRGMSAA